MAEAEGDDAVRLVGVAQVQQQRFPHRFLEPLEIEISKLVPLRHDDEAVGPFRDFIRVLAGNHPR